MEPKEEQEAELEALEAIFDKEFRISDPASATSGARFEVDIEDDVDGSVKLTISFNHPLEYPSKPILLVVHAREGLSTQRRKELQVYLEGVAKDNIEAPSAYTILEEARAWLTDNVVGKPKEEDEEEAAGKFETLDSTQQDKVEVISSKAIGTPVTVESFAEWRAKFEEEMEAQKTKEEREREANQKMTGRQMFENRTAVVSAESESFWEAETSQVLAEAAHAD